MRTLHGLGLGSLVLALSASAQTQSFSATLGLTLDVSGSTIAVGGFDHAAVRGRTPGRCTCTGGGP